MRHFCLKRASVALACLGTLLPPSALLGGEAKTPSASQTPKVEIHDVAIAADGHLRGQVLNPQGAPMSNARVALLQGKNEVAVAQTDDQGRFEIANVPAGEPLEFQVWHESGGAASNGLVGETPDAPDLKWTNRGRVSVTLQPDEVKEIKVIVPSSAFRG